MRKLVIAGLLLIVLGCAPLAPQITRSAVVNVTESRFDLVFETDLPIECKGQAAADGADTEVFEEVSGESFLHWLSFTGLEPDTVYAYEVGCPTLMLSGSTATAPKALTIPQPISVFGNIAGSYGGKGIVIAWPLRPEERGMPWGVLTLPENTGAFVISVGNARAADNVEQWFGTPDMVHFEIWEPQGKTTTMDKVYVPRVPLQLDLP